MPEILGIKAFDPKSLAPAAELPLRDLCAGQSPAVTPMTFSADD